jgi:xylulokinase
MPKYNPDARGSFTGLTPEHTPAHFARAIMEAISCMLKSNLDYIDIEADEIRIMGGGAKSKLWCNIKSSVLDKKVVTLKQNETACLGSAMFAGVGIGVFESVEKASEKLVALDKTYSADKEEYQKVYEDYKKTEKKIMQLF